MNQRITITALLGGTATPLHIDLQPDPDTRPDTGSAARRAAFAARQWQYLTVGVAADIGGHRLDLGVQRTGVPFGDLQSSTIGVGHLVHTYPVPALIAEYQRRLAGLAIDLGGLKLATASGVPLCLSTGDLRFLINCLAITVRYWEDAIGEANTGASRPQQERPTEPGHFNVEPTPSGYRAVAAICDAELRRVQQLREWLTGLAARADELATS